MNNNKPQQTTRPTMAIYSQHKDSQFIESQRTIKQLFTVYLENKSQKNLSKLRNSLIIDCLEIFEEVKISDVIYGLMLAINLFIEKHEVTANDMPLQVWHTWVHNVKPRIEKELGL